jgi:chromosome partitioning protein
MKTITFLNEKGGTGKTTLSTHTAALLAANGLRVLVLDMAPQAHATISFGLKKQGAIYDWLVRDAAPGDVIKQILPSPAITIPGQSFKGKLHIIPGNAETMGIPAQVEPEALHEALQAIADQVDVVIIDTDPSTNSLVSLIYRATDEFILPNRAEALSIDGLISAIRRIQEYEYRKLKIMGIVTNFYKEKTVLHRKNYAELTAAGLKRGWTIWKPVRDASLFAVASDKRRMVYTMRPKSLAEEAAIADIFSMVDRLQEALNYVG